MPLLGAAGLSLSLASGAPAATVGPAAHETTLGEEEISDVSLATFYVFPAPLGSVERPSIISRNERTKIPHTLDRRIDTWRT